MKNYVVKVTVLCIQVLRLVHYLVKYGYYGEMSDIKQLLGPMLSLMDGRNDKLYPKVKGRLSVLLGISDRISRGLK